MFSLAHTHETDRKRRRGGGGGGGGMKVCTMNTPLD